MKIAEVSKQYDISADTLRYYERIGLMRHVRRTESGIRDYTEQDCARIQFIKCMRGAGMSIESLIEYMGLIEEGDSTLKQRISLLEEQRDLMRTRVAEMQAGVDRLDYKIANYEKVMRRPRRSCNKRGPVALRAGFCDGWFASNSLPLILQGVRQ